MPRSGRSTISGSTPPPPATGSTRRAPTRANTGIAPPSSASRPATSSPPSSSPPAAPASRAGWPGISSPATMNGRRRSPPRWALTARCGWSIGTTTSSSTIPRRPASRTARGTPTRRRSATRVTAESSGSSMKALRPLPQPPRRATSLPPRRKSSWRCSPTTTSSGGCVPSGPSSIARRICWDATSMSSRRFWPS